MDCPASSVDLQRGEPFLPLSWRIIEAPQPASFQSVDLPVTHAQWLAFGNVPAEFDPQELAEWIFEHRQNHPFVLRGSHPALLQYLLRHGGQMLVTGREALLDLSQDHVGRKSLRELARRGRRHGEIAEWQGSEVSQAAAQLEAFLNTVRQHYPVPLSYLYRTQLPESERFFVLRSAQRVWGLISLIPNGRHSWHTELLVRDRQAPVGIMEALISHIFKTLQAEGARFWSLGEIPFYPTIPPQNLKTLALTEVGRQLDAVYSARGLYQFKAKFNPRWRPVCVYGWPHMSWLTMAGMFWRCNGHKLAFAGARLLLPHKAYRDA